MPAEHLSSESALKQRRKEIAEKLVGIRNKHNVALQGLGRRLAPAYQIGLNDDTRFFVGLRSSEDAATIKTPSIQRWIAVLRTEYITREGLILINPVGVRLGEVTLPTQQKESNGSNSPVINFNQQTALTPEEAEVVTSLATDVLQLQRAVPLLDSYTLRMRKSLRSLL